jgi:hypothetical protein
MADRAWRRWSFGAAVLLAGVMASGCGGAERAESAARAESDEASAEGYAEDSDSEDGVDEAELAAEDAEHERVVRASLAEMAAECAQPLRTSAVLPAARQITEIPESSRLCEEAEAWVIYEMNDDDSGRSPSYRFRVSLSELESEEVDDVAVQALLSSFTEKVKPIFDTAVQIRKTVIEVCDSTAAEVALYMPTASKPLAHSSGLKFCVTGSAGSSWEADAYDPRGYFLKVEFTPGQDDEIGSIDQAIERLRPLLDEFRFDALKG